MVELQTFRQQCGDLEQKVTNFMQEKEQFEKEVIRNGSFISHMCKIIFKYEEA